MCFPDLLRLRCGILRLPLINHSFALQLPPIFMAYSQFSLIDGYTSLEGSLPTSAEVASGPLGSPPATCTMSFSSHLSATGEDILSHTERLLDLPLENVPRL